MSAICELKIRKRDESKHFLTIGDTGVGKSTFIKQIAYYAESLGESCVMLDSGGKFIQEFYSPERGDLILNPKDARGASWFIGREITDEPDALGVTRALFPSHPSNPQAQFWDDYAWRVSAYILQALLSSGNPPDCQEFARILISEARISDLVKRSEYGELFSPRGSSLMRTSVIQTLSTIGYALRMMPTPTEAPAFTFREWLQNPLQNPTPPWIFLSSTSQVREALRPIQSAWADIAIKRAMSRPEGSARIWIILDELDSLHTLPVLSEAITMGRKTNIILVVGIQNVAQLEDRYGKQAETIFSQAGTKIILATSHGKSAKDLEQLLGEEEIRLVRQSRTAGIFGGRERDSYSGPEETRKPVIMASQIQGLPDLCGYLVQRPTQKSVGLHIVPIEFPLIDSQTNEPDLVERMIPTIDIRFDEYAEVVSTDSPYGTEPPPPPSSGVVVRY